MTRVVLTVAADADTAILFADLYDKAGKITVTKYRGLLKKLYGLLADFPQSGAMRTNLGHNIRIAMVLP